MGKDSTIKFIGLDVHSKTISVAIADEGRKGEVRHYETIDNTIEAIDKVIKSITARLYLSNWYNDWGQASLLFNLCLSPFSSLFLGQRRFKQGFED